MEIGNDNSVRYGFARECFNKPFTLSKVEWFIFFIYVVACLPSSYIELLSRQRLMLKITLIILQKIL